jgi:hypothetical protein
LRKQNKVYHVSEAGDRTYTTPGLIKVIMSNPEHLVKAERDVVGPVMIDYYDLFPYDRSVTLPCTGRGLHEIKTGGAWSIMKSPYKVPFVLRAETKRQMNCYSEV